MLPDLFHDEHYSTGDVSNPLAIIHHEIKAHVLPLKEAEGLVPGREMLREQSLPERQLNWGLDDGTIDHTLHESSVNETLFTKVHEGSEGINNRWTSFSQVAGHYIAMSNEGKCTVDAAYDYVMGWMQSNMVPAKRDIEQQVDLELKKAEVPGVSGQGLESWAVTNWTKGDPPPRKFLVNRLIPDAIPMLFVSEGGGGKTFSAIDLALKVSSYTPQCQFMWIGQSLTPHCNGATVVMITAEDDRDELHRRIVIPMS